MSATCSLCGAPDTGGEFCDRCGQRLRQTHAPAAPPPPPSPVAPAPAVSHPSSPTTASAPAAATLAQPSGTGPDRQRLVVIGAVVAVLLAAGLVFYMLSRDSTPEAVTGSGSGSTSQAPTDDGGSGTEEGSDDELAVTPEAEEPAEELTCWDGTAVAARGDCPDLTGDDGMRWVFAAVDAAYPDCAPARVYDGKINALRCVVALPGGRRIPMTFSEFGTPAQLRDHYFAKYGEPRESGDRLLFGPSPVGAAGGLQGSMIYADGRRWSATVASNRLRAGPHGAAHDHDAIGAGDE